MHVFKKSVFFKKISMNLQTVNNIQKPQTPFSWNTLPKPFFVLAPMEDVTDTVFRQMVVKTGRPEVFVTEFTSIEGIWSPGTLHVTQRLQYTQSERPIIAQVWGNKPELFYKTAQYVQEQGFDGIDINMGCPVRAVMKQKCGSALIGHYSLVAEIIDAVRRGAPTLPFSIKTRIGIKSILTEEWISFLLLQKLDALTIHGRTAAEQSGVPAHWDQIGYAVELRNKLNPQTIIIGNGDVADHGEGTAKHQQFGVDGIMIGRGIFHNPWAFTHISQGRTLPRSDLAPSHDSNSDDAHPEARSDPMETHTISERLTLLKQHIDLYEQTWGKKKNFNVLKKYFKIYLSGFNGAKEARETIMSVKTFDEAKNIVNTLKNTLVQNQR